jgi:UDP-N-acetylglucosamine enolpyruvyl transferase
VPPLPGGCAIGQRLIDPRYVSQEGGFKVVVIHCCLNFADRILQSGDLQILDPNRCPDFAIGLI